MNASEPDRGSSRVEREVLEILERADASQTPTENLHAAVRRQSTSAQAQMSKTMQTEWIQRARTSDILRLGGALLLAICAAMFADVSRVIATVLAIASAAVLFSLWAPSGTSTIGRDSPRWRGRDLRDPDGPPDFDIRRVWPGRGPKGPPR